jgi:hypothetical protein
MPLTINGFGTAYFGKKDKDEKGIYVTTKFLAMFYVPVFPLASYWVMPHGTPVVTRVIRLQEFDAIEIPLDWRQVLSVYFKWYVGIALAITSFLFVIGVFVEYRDMSEGKKSYPGSQSIMTRNVAAYFIRLTSDASQSRNSP